MKVAHLNVFDRTRDVVFIDDSTSIWSDLETRPKWRNKLGVAATLISCTEPNTTLGWSTNCEHLVQFPLSTCMFGVCSLIYTQPTPLKCFCSIKKKMWPWNVQGPLTLYIIMVIQFMIFCLSLIMLKIKNMWEGYTLILNPSFDYLSYEDTYIWMVCNVVWLQEWIPNRHRFKGIEIACSNFNYNQHFHPPLLEFALPFGRCCEQSPLWCHPNF